MKNSEEEIYKEIDQLLTEENPIRAILIATTKLGWTFEEAIFKLPERYEDLYKQEKVELSVKEYWKNFYS